MPIAGKGACESLIPSDEMLLRIQSGQEEFRFLLFAVPTPGREKIPGMNKYEVEEWIEFVFSVLKNSYSPRFGQGKEFNYQFAGEIFGEALTNAQGHGNRFLSEKLLKVGIWLGSEGVIFAVEDEGGFFKDASVRARVFSRCRIPSTATDQTGGGMGEGMNCIYQADQIAIAGNTLFLMVKAERFFE